MLVASSGATLLEGEAIGALVARLFPLATVVTPNLAEAQALTGSPTLVAKDELARRVVALGAPAAIVTGGHGAPVDHLFDGREHVEIPVERLDVAATHGAGCTHSATLAGAARKRAVTRRRRLRRGARCDRGRASRARRDRRW